MITNFFQQRVRTNSPYFTLTLVILFILLSLYFIYEDFIIQSPNPLYTISLLLVSLVAIQIFCVLLVSNRVSSKFFFMKRGKRRVSKLRKRIIIAFSIGSACPTIIVAIFSTYFFNCGVEAWFDQKISKVLNQSIIVGESYINEHIFQLKETAISVSDDINTMYYDLIHNFELFSKVIDAQARMRAIDEAVVFQKNKHTILARSKCSFLLRFVTIPSYFIERADKGEVVQITSDPSKIRILIKLRDYNDTYLLIGRFIDTKIIDHISKTNGTAKEYFLLKNQISLMQIKFAVVFILLSIILLLVATICGRNFAERIVSPIRELVIAAEKVKNGDLSVQVPLKGLRKDEVKILSSAFNRMVSQIDRQQKELVVAQRALAWSDVARRVAHEIKNPLTPIQLSAELILKKYKHQVTDTKTFEKYLRNILKHSEDIKDIVSEFVEFARLPAPNFAQYEIISFISDLVESRKLINDTITYNFISNVREFKFLCDVSQMNRIVVNLLLNCEEAFIDTQLDRVINVSINCNMYSLKIKFDDNGPGFKEEMLDSAKEAYISTKSDGTGLGLTIVNRIVAEHCGELKISNNIDGGASVELIFNISE